MAASPHAIAVPPAGSCLSNRLPLSAHCKRNASFLGVQGRTATALAIRAAAGADDDKGKPSRPPRPDGMPEERIKGIFEFVIDNPSSKSAIQLPYSPASEGNLGQMISEIEGKGRDYGSYITVGDFQYFIRQLGPTSGDLVLFLHGAPAQSWGYRNIITALADKGYCSVAPDWLGFGFSDKPQPGYYFSYTEDAYHEEMDKLLEELQVNEPFHLVVQGFLVGSYGLTWALKNPSRLKSLSILNTPLSANLRLPTELSSLRIPFVGEFACQNAILAERFIEKGSPYMLENDDSDVYRLPYLDSGDPGFALLEVARKFDLAGVGKRIADGFRSSSWNVPTSVLWGPQDPFLPVSEAQAFAKSNESAISLQLLEGAGHMPQEDWAEKVIDGLLTTFSRGKETSS